MTRFVLGQSGPESWVISDVHRDQAIYLIRDEAWQLRDLLLREFPLAGGQLIGSSGQSVAKERRERIATAVLAGFAANQVCDPMAKPNVATAIVWADALIAALDKE